MSDSKVDKGDKHCIRSKIKGDETSIITTRHEK